MNTFLPSNSASGSLQARRDGQGQKGKRLRDPRGAETTHARRMPPELTEL